MKTSPKVNKKSFKEHINSIINNPLNALMEIIANAYDAGAQEVNITWPQIDTLDETNPNKLAIIKDDGHGMAHEEFKEIWSELSYDRLKKQGNSVEVLVNGKIIKRKVYGKEGRGRHAVFAFCDNYTVKTVKDNKESVFKINLSQNGFDIDDLDRSAKSTNAKNGTEISFNVIKNNKSIEEVREAIATRFIKDDTFLIKLNSEIIDLTDINENMVNKINCPINNNENIEILELESSTKSNYKKFHGIRWKIANRLIEDENWEQVLDGRTKNSKKFLFIVNADILKDYINEDMTGFEDNQFVLDVKDKVHNCIKNSLNKHLEKRNEANKKKILENNFPDLKKLSRIDKEEVGLFISEIQKDNPNINFNELEAISTILIKLKQANSGYELLHRLSSLKPDDYDSLNDILNEWDIRDAKIVLDEIKKRLDLIKQLRLKVDNPNTDELHELQPLFEKGLWIFGPEYESIEFTSNRRLITVAREIFKKENIEIESPNLRPDFIVIPSQKAISFYSSNKFDDDGEVCGINKVLVVELKRGDSIIGLNEIQQVERYIEQLQDAGLITSDMVVNAFVLGSKVQTREKKWDDVVVKPMEYSTILIRAEKRLFDLERKIMEAKNINNDTDDKIINQVLKQDNLDGFGFI